MLTSMRAAMVSASLLAVGCSSSPSSTTPTSTPTTKQELGALIFADTNLSQPTGQACADCHDPKVAFRDLESDHSTSAGAVDGRFGPRNAPTAMYARFIPALHFDTTRQRFVGGLFWDGRADTLEAQAALPLLNPLEMNNADKAAVVAQVRAASYAPVFRSIFGSTALDDGDAFVHVTEAIAAFERSPAFAPFSSKYDRYLAGTESLTVQEQRGLAIFEDPARGNCASCHPSRPSADGTPPLFTDFSYANLGIPTYQNSQFLVQPAPLNPDGDRYIDHGLMKTVGDPQQDGKFRVPTLRNITRTGPFGHNGYFENVPYLLDFLNTRDVAGLWATPEIPATIDTAVGHLGLSHQDLDDLEVFLETLTDEP